MINIPYFSLATEMTSNYYEKNKMNNIRQIFSSSSTAISAGVPIILLEMLQNGEISLNTFSLIMVLGFGALYGGTMMVTSIVCKERLPLPEDKIKFDLRSFTKPLQLKAFAYLALMYLCAFSCMDLITTNLVWFADYALKLNYSSFILLAALMAAYISMIPFYAYMMRNNRSKSFLFRLGIPLYIGSIAAMSLYPSSWSSYPILALAATAGIGMSGCQFMPWYIFPDVVDLGELKFKERNTGSYSGIMTFVRKITSALAIGISGWALQLSGFKKPVTDLRTGIVTKFAQTDAAVLGLRLVILIPIALFISIAYIASKKLKISSSRSILVSKVNLVGGSTENLSQDELEELEAIEKELF
jgi:Na+/melibiose symporter-like transporter